MNLDTICKAARGDELLRETNGDRVNIESDAVGGWELRS